MVKTIIFTFFSLLVLVNTAKSQYINTDSLVVLEGAESAILLSELDSIDLFSPDVMPNNFTQGTLTSGYLLSMFALPASGQIISRFGPRSGRMHTGTDIKMNKGDTIYAAFDGIVTRAKYYYGYGNMIVLDHGNNIESYYAHLSAFLVENECNVAKGEPIGLAGATGRATTSHLHFEVRENDKPYDSELVFDYENEKPRTQVAEKENLAELLKELRPKGYSVNKPVSQKYVVRSGDSLSKISLKNKTSIKSLCILNNLSETSILQIGQVLNVF